MKSTRRALLTGVAASSLLAGCAGSNSLNNFAKELFTDVVTVAKVIEQAVVVAVNDMTAAVNMLLKYVVPVCQIVVTLDALGNQLIKSGVLDGTNSAVKQAMGVANDLSTNAVIQAAAQNGVIPTSPVTILTGIIQAVTEVMSLTGAKVSPTAAVTA